MRRDRRDWELGFGVRVVCSSLRNVLVPRRELADLVLVGVAGSGLEGAVDGFSDSGEVEALTSAQYRVASYYESNR